MDGTTGDSEPRIDASDLLQDVVSVSSTSGLETDLQDLQADAKESEASVQHDGDFGVYTPSGPNTSTIHTVNRICLMLFWTPTEK